MPSSSIINSKRSCTRLNDKDHQNRYIIESSEPNSIKKSVSKHNSGTKITSNHKKKNKQSIKDLLRDSYIFVRQENQALSLKIRKKSRKVDELKNRITDYESEIQQYKQHISSLENVMKEKGIQVSTRYTQNTLASSRKKYESILKESQELARTALEKYKKIERKMNSQRQKYETQIQKLTRFNKNLELEVELLLQKSTSNNKSQQKKSKSTKKIVHIDDCLEKQITQLRFKEESWKKKENDLKIMLEQITRKIHQVQLNSKKVQNENEKFKVKFQQLNQKYLRKKAKHNKNNQQWGQIFKSFLKEAQSIGDQIFDLKKTMKTLH